MQNQELLQEARNYFQATGYCAHSTEFRNVSKLYGLKIETCRVCAKEFKRCLV